MRFAVALLLALAAGSAAGQAARIERLSTPWSEDGQAVDLVLATFMPTGPGPFPTLIFNHGSVGDGNDPREVGHTVTYPALARYFNDRGWMVVVPQRRGRGGSGGRYLEGWSAEERRYACDSATASASLQRAMEDLSEVLRHLQARMDVDSRRLLVGGHSKGGLLALTFAARQPRQFIGAVNFVGGWVGERCATAGEVNGGAFTRAARFAGPSLWLYGDRDPYYDIAHSRRNFEAFRAAGGQGEFHVLRTASQWHDHQIVHSRAEWQDLMSAFLATLR